MGKGWPYAAAAAGRRAARAARSRPCWCWPSRSTTAAVRKLAEKARGGVLLSDGTRAVIEAGPEPEREQLRAAVGCGDARADLREQATAPGPPPSARWSRGCGCGRSRAAPPPRTRRRAPPPATRRASGVAACLVAVIALFIGLRGSAPRRGPTGELAAEAAAAPTPGPSAARSAAGPASNAPRGRPGPAPSAAPQTGEGQAAPRCTSRTTARAPTADGASGPSASGATSWSICWARAGWPRCTRP